MPILARRSARLAIVVGLSLPVACASLSGLQGGSVDGGPDAASDSSSGDARPDGTTDGMPPDGPAPDAAPDATSDAPTDAAPCASDASFTSDMHNCGRCGHDCLGGACTGGVCQPVTLYGGLAFVTSLAVDDVNLYWATNSLTSGAVSYGPKGGGAPADLSTTPQPTTGLAIDDTSVYWTSTSSIVSCPKPPSPCMSPTVRASATANQIVVDTTRLYWTQGGSPGGLFAVPKAGGPVVELAAADSSSSLALGGARIFWASAMGLEAYDLGNAAATVLVPSPSIGQVAASDTSVFWFEILNSSLYGCASTACDAGVVVVGSLTALVADATSLYYALQPGTLWVYTPPGRPSPLATSGNDTVAMAVDASAVYFSSAANGISTIQRVAKP